MDQLFSFANFLMGIRNGLQGQHFHFTFLDLYFVIFAIVALSEDRQDRATGLDLKNHLILAIVNLDSLSTNSYKREEFIMDGLLARSVSE